MPREWVGVTWRSKGLETYSAKWKEWGTQRWRRTSGFGSRAEAADFLAQKRREYRQRQRGDFDEFAAARKRPIAEHVADFRDHLLSHRRRRSAARSEKHANQSKQRLLDAFAQMRVRTMADLTGTAVDRFLARMLDVEHRTVKTRNDYAAVLGQFTRWAVADQRLDRDPIALLRKIENIAGPARKQTMGWEQVRALAAAAPQRVLQQTRGTKPEVLEQARRRGLAVITMFLTGLRNNELAHLCWGWIDFVGRRITVPHEVAKSARTEYVPLHRGLGQLLQQERRRRAVLSGRPVAGTELVVGDARKHGPGLSTHVNARLRSDLKWLRLPTVDDKGRRLSLYSMRTSFATQLTALGVADGIVGDLMRHRPRTVTLQHYVEREIGMLLEAMDRIPAEAAHVPGLWSADHETDQDTSAPGGAVVRGGAELPQAGAS